MKAVLMILVVVASLIASAGWTVNGMRNDMNSVCRSSVLSHARGIAKMFETSRQVYADLRCDEHDPLPITFARALSANSECEIDIYSPYPFPQNADGGLRDDFQKAAWASLSGDGDKEYFEWGPNVLRYAIPDVMTQKCVTCHNSATGTPFDSWEKGDVRGVLEVILPVPY